MSNIIQFNWNTNALFYPILMAIIFPIRSIYTNKLLDEFTPLFLTFVMFAAQTTSGIFEIIKKCNSNIYQIRDSDVNIHKKCKLDWGNILLLVSSGLDLFEFTIINYMISKSNGNMSFIFRMGQIFF